jgi:hypothetical protein
MAWKRWVAGVLCLAGATFLRAQNATETFTTAAPVQLTLRRSIELALSFCPIFMRVPEQATHMDCRRRREVAHLRSST